MIRCRISDINGHIRNLEWESKSALEERWNTRIDMPSKDDLVLLATVEDVSMKVYPLTTFTEFLDFVGISERKKAV